ncbi:MAG TPA: HPr-rel-A system PqqD family peptide chaperone [Candidatus Sulfotelmatobacter sp.]|nr:HPr-rel-A system PqqD family peptide chaperone [Candidatus Sulfotelmatobacter sp.]
MTGRERSWRVPVRTRLLWRSYEEHFIVYNCASGQTHYLNLLAAMALQQMEERPATIDELGQRIRVQAGVDDIAGLAQLPALVAQLDELGLIAPTPP